MDTAEITLNHHTFVSHSFEDKEIALDIVRRLEKRGISCWIAPRDIPFGSDYIHALAEGVQKSASLIVVVTKNSIESKHVPREISLADDYDKLILPILNNVAITPALKLLLGNAQFAEYNNDNHEYSNNETYDKLAARILASSNLPKLLLHEDALTVDEANGLGESVVRKKTIKSGLITKKHMSIAMLVAITCGALVLLGKTRENKEVISVTIQPTTATESSNSKKLTTSVESSPSVKSTININTDSENDSNLAVNLPVIINIPAGTFTIGSSDANESSDEKSRNNVFVREFGIGEKEITVSQYNAFLTKTGIPSLDDPGQNPNNPVTRVTWQNAFKYTQWLSSETGDSYRLPTEAEWEYAARAGTTSDFHYGDALTSESANFGSAGVVAVGRYSPNDFGLYDVHGNVSEWTCSEYIFSYDGYEDKCVFESSEGNRVIRGGDWSDGSDKLRSAYRNYNEPSFYDKDLGFRVVRDVTP